jgi:hypothetical protein
VCVVIVIQMLIEFILNNYMLKLHALYVRIKDRWQAASDMGGTAIPGAHWVIMDFGTLVTVSAVVLDWETAHATQYRLEGRGKNEEEWQVFYDGSETIEMSG